MQINETMLDEGDDMKVSSSLSCGLLNLKRALQTERVNNAVEVMSSTKCSGTIISPGLFFDLLNTTAFSSASSGSLNCDWLRRSHDIGLLLLCYSLVSSFASSERRSPRNRNSLNPSLLTVLKHLRSISDVLNYVRMTSHLIMPISNSNRGKFWLTVYPFMFMVNHLDNHIEK